MQLGCGTRLFLLLLGVIVMVSVGFGVWSAGIAVAQQVQDNPRYQEQLGLDIDDPTRPLPTSIKIVVGVIAYVVAWVCSFVVGRCVGGYCQRAAFRAAVRNQVAIEWAMLGRATGASRAMQEAVNESVRRVEQFKGR